MIEVFAISCLCFMITYYGPVEFIKKHTGLKKVKPFDCPKCLGFWIGLAYFIYTGANVPDVIMGAAACSVTALLIELTLIRLKNG